MKRLILGRHITVSLFRVVGNGLVPAEPGRQKLTTQRLTILTVSDPIEIEFCGQMVQAVEILDKDPLEGMYLSLFGNAGIRHQVEAQQSHLT